MEHAGMYMTPERAVRIAAALVTALVLALAARACVASPQSEAFTPIVSQRDLYNCLDFGTRERAQLFLEIDPADPHRLDADRDGEACEELP